MKHKIIVVLLICLNLFLSCKKKATPTAEILPEIYCGTSFTMNCISDKWIVSKPSTASYYHLPTGYQGKSCLLLVNPHPPNQPNPPSIGFLSIIQHLKKNTAYRIRCDARISGYPDILNAPSFAFYAFSNTAWYGEHYYVTTPGVKHVSDWSQHAYIFTTGEETSLKFEFFSLYDSLWIANFNISEY